MVFQYARSGLTFVTNWLVKDLLTLNVDKTNYLTFSLSAAGKPLSSSFALIAHSCNSPHNTVCNCPHLNRVSCIKYLGVQICLSFSTQKDTLTSRLRRLIYVFSNLRYVADTKVIRLVYLALCQSLIQYCIVTWGGSGKTHVKIGTCPKSSLKSWLAITTPQTVASTKSVTHRFPNLYRSCFT